MRKRAGTSTLVEVDSIAIKPKATVGTGQVESSEPTAAVADHTYKSVLDIVAVSLWPK